MDRRAALALMFVAAHAPLALAQAAGRHRRIGFLTAGEGTGSPRRLSARLAQLGYVEGKNLHFEMRRVRPDASTAELDAAAGELARSGVELLVGAGVTHLTALRKATKTIPIVSGGVSNPVGLGVAQSLRRPGMNVTGLSYGLEEAAVLQVATLRALQPRLKRIVFVASAPDSKMAPEHEAAGAAAGIATDISVVRDAAELEKLFATVDHRRDAAWIGYLPPRMTQADGAQMAIRHRVPTHALSVDAVRAGFLMSYWIVHADPPARIAAVIDQILRGGDPAQIPFQLPDLTSFALNRATAGAIGLKVPPDLLVRATEVVD